MPVQSIDARASGSKLMQRWIGLFALLLACPVATALPNVELASTAQEAEGEVEFVDTVTSRQDGIVELHVFVNRTIEGGRVTPALRSDMVLQPRESLVVFSMRAPADEPVEYRTEIVAVDPSGVRRLSTTGSYRPEPPVPEPILLAGAGAIGGFAGLVVGTALHPRWRGALGLPLLPLYSRLRPDALPPNERRERILAIVRARGAVGYAELLREAGVGASVLVHHLRVLERAQLVQTRRVGIRRAICAVGIEAPPELRAASARVLDALRGGPLTQREVVERVGLSQQGVSYHLQNLRRAGAVEPTREGFRTRWRLTRS